MDFNQNQSYRWVSQPQRFPGQQLDGGGHDQKSVYVLRNNHPPSIVETPVSKADFLSHPFLSLRTFIRQFRQQPQNS